MTALFCARVSESEYKVTFIDLAGEFEYIETSPGLAQLIGENGG